MPGPVAGIIGSAGRFAGAASKGMGSAWAWSAAFDLFERCITSTWAHVPTFTHAITVAVTGGPSADLRRMWYLACAIAFGRMRRSPALRGGSATMEATWDVSGKVAQIALVFTVAKMQYSETTARPSDVGRAIGEWLVRRMGRVVGGVPIGMADAGPALSPKDSPLTLIQQGPDQISVGGGWPGFLLRGDQVNAVRPRPPASMLAEIAAVNPRWVVTPVGRVNRSGTNLGHLFREWPTAVKGEATFIPFQLTELVDAPHPALAGTPVDRVRVPTLPDDGRLITTGEKSNVAVQSPRPCVDGATRSSLVALVANALSDPCFLPPLPAVGPAPLHSTGYSLYPPGSSLNYPDTSDRVQNAPNAGSRIDAEPDGHFVPFLAPDMR